MKIVQRSDFNGLQVFLDTQDIIVKYLTSDCMVLCRLSVDPNSVQSEDRERAKRVVYSVVYGVGR